MSPATKLSSAFRRLGAAVGVRLVRADEELCEQRHGGPPEKVDDRMKSFAIEVEHQAITAERALQPKRFDVDAARRAAAESI